MEQLTTDDRIAEWLLIIVPELKEVVRNAGIISDSELDRLGAKPPAIWLHQVGTRDYSSTGCRLIHKATFTAFIIVGDCRGGRNASSKKIAQTIANALPSANFDQARAVEAGTIKTVNLTNGTYDTMGLSIWAITWEQIVTIQQEL